MESGEGRPATWSARLRSTVRDPAAWVEASQAAKTVVAGVLAWFVATDVFGLEQPFLAPWSAVLIVHATVYLTVSRGAQQVAATVLGVVLAWAAGHLFGLGPLPMGVTLAACLLLGHLRWLRAEAMTLLTTGIIVLATNAISEAVVLAERLLATVVGLGVGLLVNLLVWPPLRDRAAWSRAEQLPRDVGKVLATMADDLASDVNQGDIDAWDARLREIDDRLEQTWGLLRQAEESARFNPRRTTPTRLEELGKVLAWLEQALSDTRSMARTIAMSLDDERVWEDDFRARWADLLTVTADAVLGEDREGLGGVRTELQALADDLSTDSLLRSAWHEYGGLLVNLRNVVAALGHAAELTDHGGRRGHQHGVAAVRGAISTARQRGRG